MPAAILDNAPHLSTPHMQLNTENLFNLLNWKETDCQSANTCLWTSDFDLKYLEYSVFSYFEESQITLGVMCYHPEAGTENRRSSFEFIKGNKNVECFWRVNFHSLYQNFEQNIKCRLIRAWWLCVHSLEYLSLFDLCQTFVIIFVLVLLWERRKLRVAVCLYRCVLEKKTGTNG